MVGQILKYEFIRDIFSINCSNNTNHNVILQRLVAPCYVDYNVSDCVRDYLEVIGGLKDEQ